MHAGTEHRCLPHCPPEQRSRHRGHTQVLCCLHDRYPAFINLMCDFYSLNATCGEDVDLYGGALEGDERERRDGTGDATIQ